jgi:glycosyltransferase involved in cell wall biosynthesis
MKKNPQQLKVALVHDYLREYGGAERVVEALHSIFPEAPLYVAFTDSKVAGIHWQKFKDWDIRQSWLTLIPFYKKLFSPLRIFAPNYFSSFDLSKYDVVISSSNAYFGKAVRVRANALHICYCHTPARSLYGYSTMTDWESKPVTKFFGTVINHYLRVIDYKVAQKVGFFIANSEEVKKRIWKFYRRESVVIYPPVNVPESWEQVQKWRKENDQAGEYYIYVNRLAFAKHPELAIQACTKLGVPLKVVGSGAIEDELKKMAGPTVQFLGSVGDDQLHALYAGAKALLYPVEDEDFGIVPVEAMGHGVPVIAHRSGGPQETILEGETGIFFDELSLNGLLEAMHIVQSRKWNSKKIYEHAQQFSLKKFKEKITKFVDKHSAGQLGRSY